MSGPYHDYLTHFTFVQANLWKLLSVENLQRPPRNAEQTEFLESWDILKLVADITATGVSVTDPNGSGVTISYAPQEMNIDKALKLLRAGIKLDEDLRIKLGEYLSQEENWSTSDGEWSSSWESS